MKLNENIKLFRKEAGLTQKTLASRSGLSFSMVSKLESGEQANPSFETIRKLADALQVSAKELVDTSASFEDQIDEYIEYKRGTGKNGLRTATTAAELQEPCTDLNFRKKMQAINQAPMPAGNRDELKDRLDRRPELKRLIYTLEDSTGDEIEQITRLVEVFRKTQ